MKEIHYKSPAEIVQSSVNKVDQYYNSTTDIAIDPELASMKSIMSGNAQRERLFTTEKTIDVNTNFTRLNDGSYIPNYKNVIGNFGNEDRLASQQSAGEKWLHGMTKMVSKAGTYAADATIGTIYGLYKGISEGSLDAVWSNEFSQYIDDLNTQLDGNLPNYYTDAEKNMSVWESLGTANFWANDFSNGLAFVGGNLLSGNISSFATGGLKLTTKLPQLALKTGGKKTTKQVFKSADEILKTTPRAAEDISRVGFEKATQLGELNKAFKTADIDRMVEATNKEILKSTTLGRVGKGIDIAAFSVRTGTFEAGLEARQNFNQSYDTFVQNYRNQHGKAPSLQEVTDFKTEATNTANWLFAGNMAILAPSNMAMFGKASGIGLNTSKKFNSYINKNLYGKGVNFTKQSGIITATGIEATKLQKNISRVNSLFGKAATEGLYEEGFQGVAGKTMQNYLESKYDPNSVGRDVSLWSSLYESFGEQYGTKEGWKEMFIGSLIGGIGAPALISSTKGKPGEFIKDVGQNISQSNVKEANESLANAYNDAYVGMQKKLSGQSALINSANTQSILSNGKTLDDKDSEVTLDYNEALQAESQSNFDYISVMEGHMSDSEITADYDFLVNNLEISEEAIKQGVTEDQFEEYKDELKVKFSENLSSTRKAKNAAEALGLGSYIDSQGNTREASDVVARTIYEGIEALPLAKRVAEQLDQAVGEDGMFSVLNMMNSLTKEQQGLTQEFVTLKDNKVKKEKLSLELQRKLSEQALRTEEIRKATQVTKRGVSISEKALDKKREAQLKNAEALTRINEEIADTDIRLTEIKEELNTVSRVENAGLSNLYGVTGEGLVGFDIEQALDKLENLDKFTDHLRNTGKNRDAAIIDKLTDDFVGYATKSRNLQTLHRKMLDPSFFKKKKGKTLLSDILGKKYTVSDEFKTKLDENNNRIIQVLTERGMLKYPEAITLNDLVENNVVNNEQLSDREKFRMESILKAQMVQLNILNTTLAAEETNEVIVPTNLVKGGDSVKFSRELNEVLKDKIITNAQQLDKLIGTIVKEVNKIFDIKGRPITSSDIKNLEKKHNVEINQNEDGSYKVEPKIGKVQEVTKEVFDKFVDTGKVSDEVLNALTIKVKDREDLTIQEQAIKAEFGNQINEILQGVSSAETEIKVVQNPGFKIITNEDFKRLEQLLDKQLKSEELTEGELSELDTLQTEFDRWTLAEGTVVNGVRLSDLIRRRLNYENLTVEVEDDIFSLDGFEAMSLSEFESRGTDNYYFLAQSAINATVIKQQEGIAIHNISAGEIASIMGARVGIQDPPPNTQVEFTLDTTEGEVNIVANVDQKGNLIFNETDITIINENTNLVVTPTNLELSTRYSVLLQKDADGNIRPVESDYNYQGEFIDAESIYDLKKGEKLTAVVDPKDEYNQDLLEGITRSISPSEQKVAKELKTRLIQNEEYQDALANAQGFKEGTPQQQEGVSLELSIRNETTRQIIEDFTKDKIDAFSKENETMLVNNMVIKLYKGNSLVGVMKGINSLGMLTAKDQQFEIARQAIIKNNLAKLIDGSNDDIVATEVEVIASEVFLGHPNYNFVESETGLGTQFEDIVAHNIKKIVDVGYLENEEVTLKNNTKEVDTTYLSKLKRKTGKQPVIILNFAGKKVAYPVNIKNQDKTSIVDEIETILDSKITMIEKGIEIDRRLAQIGIDPNVRGNSLEYFSNTNNTFNEKNIQNFLVSVKNKPYIYSLEEWFKEDLTLEEIVSTQVQVNIDLNNPFHSPKFKMNFPTIDPPVPTQQKQHGNNSKTKKQSVTSTVTTQQAADVLKKC